MEGLFVCRLLLITLFLVNLPYNNRAQTSNSKNKIEIIENKLFKGKDLETKFKISYIDQVKKSTLFFEVIKTNATLQNFFLADYLLIERINSATQYYPLGWSGTKISEKDIHLNCMSIVKGEVSPVIPE